MALQPGGGHCSRTGSLTLRPLSLVAEPVCLILELNTQWQCSERETNLYTAEHGRRTYRLQHCAVIGIYNAVTSLVHFRHTHRETSGVNTVCSHRWMSEWVSRFLTAELGYTVPFTLVHAGKYRTEDRLKTDDTETNTMQKQANNTKHSKTKLPWFSRFLWHSARKRVYSTMLLSWAHMGGADGQTDLDKVIVKDKIIEHCDIYCRMLTEVLLTYLLNLLTCCNISNYVIHLSGTLALLSIICSTCQSAAFNCTHHPLHTILSVLLVLHSAQAGLNRHLTMVSCHQSSW